MSEHIKSAESENAEFQRSQRDEIREKLKEVRDMDMEPPPLPAPCPIARSLRRSSTRYVW